MQVGAWYKFLYQKDENVNSPVKTTVSDSGKSFVQAEKLISRKPPEIFSTSRYSEIREITKGT